MTENPILLPLIDDDGDDEQKYGKKLYQSRFHSNEKIYIIEQVFEFLGVFTDDLPGKIRENNPAFDWVFVEESMELIRQAFSWD